MGKKKDGNLLNSLNKWLALCTTMYALVKNFKTTVKKLYFNHSLPPVTLFQYLHYTKRQTDNYVSESVHFRHNFVLLNYNN